MSTKPSSGVSNPHSTVSECLHDLCFDLALLSMARCSHNKLWRSAVSWQELDSENFIDPRKSSNHPDLHVLDVSQLQYTRSQTRTCYQAYNRKYMPDILRLYAGGQFQLGT